MAGEAEGNNVGVRIITAAPEIEGVKAGVEEAVKRGIVFSIGHRSVISGTLVCAIGVLILPS